MLFWFVCLGKGCLAGWFLLSGVPSLAEELLCAWQSSPLCDEAYQHSKVHHCVMKLTCTLTKMLRETMAREETQMWPCQVILRPIREIISLLKAHHQKLRRVQGCKMTGTKDHWGTNTLSRPLPGLSQKSLSCSILMKNPSQWGAVNSLNHISGQGEMLPRSGMHQFGLYRIYYGTFRGGIKGRKLRGLGDLGRNKSGRIEG